MLPVPKHLLARLLFPNPACALVTPNAAPASSSGEPLQPPPASPPAPSLEYDPRAFNAMTVTWLSPVDNHGHFVMSLNSGRHSAGNLMRAGAAGGRFTLSPAVAGQEPLLLALGSCSGREPLPAAADSGPVPAGRGKGAGRGGVNADVGRDKVARCGLALVRPGSVAAAAASTAASADVVMSSSGPGRPRASTASSADATTQLHAVPAAHGAAAHLVCRVVSVLMGAPPQALPPPSACTDDGDDAGAGGAPPPPPPAQPSAKRRALAAEDTSSSSTATAAHHTTTVPDIGHTLLLCRVDAGWVAPSYWHEGKLFGALPPAPPLLAFAGSHTFVHMTLGPAGTATEAQPSPGQPTVEAFGQQPALQCDA
jgi:flavin reductase (DIM6/NTAB) family NADH-FMN oxidoreductase RutF